jgi:hypothetical protein
MDAKLKNEIIANPDHSISALKTTVHQKEVENPGVIKRFLNWIAKGAERSRMSGNSCPT